ncbi:MAG: hypothetical protein WCP35_19915, partial [Verrucomicrobiota bacterium]
MHPPAAASAHLAQAVQEQQVVVLCHENGLAPVTAGHHVIDRARILKSQGPRHAQTLPGNL